MTNQLSNTKIATSCRSSQTNSLNNNKKLATPSTTTTRQPNHAGLVSCHNTPHLPPSPSKNIPCFVVQRPSTFRSSKQFNTKASTTRLHPFNQTKHPRHDALPTAAAAATFYPGRAPRPFRVSRCWQATPTWTWTVTLEATPMGGVTCGGVRAVAPRPPLLLPLETSSSCQSDIQC
jgi:hypothetical protein